jgi:hypothetical protein
MSAASSASSARTGAEEFSVAAIETLRAAIEFKIDLAHPLLRPVLARQATQRFSVGQHGDSGALPGEEARKDTQVPRGSEGARERLSATARRGP